MISVSHITVRYQETDQMGIVHHSVYPVWYEVARTDFCKKMGLPYIEMERLGIMTPIYEVHSKYHKPACYDDVLEVETKLIKLTPFRLEFSYHIYKNSNLIHSGATVHVWVDSEQFKPLNLQKKFPQIFQMLKDTIESEEDSK